MNGRSIGWNGLAVVLAACPGAPPEAEIIVREDTLAAARDDGYVYTIDVGLRLEAAAIAGDRAAWAAQLPSVTRVTHDDPADPWSRGMVAWRWKEGNPPDASGTTEALRVASGLWRGATMFSQPDASRTALALLAGYARHAREDRGIWFIANYFNFGTKALATNSFLVDYDPDFLAEVAQSPLAGATQLADLAERSCALVRSAHAPAGLLYDIVQPEVATLAPDGPVIFSPNDIVQINTSATVAERSVRCDPALAAGVLAFALAHESDLRVAYYGRTGETASATQAAPDTWAVLARLAHRTGDDVSAARFAGRIGSPTDVYTLGEAMLTSAYLGGSQPTSR